jgi:uncharacterized membrane protein
MLTKPEFAIVAGAAVLFAGYHVYFARQVRRGGDRTVIGQAKRWRREWVQRMIARQDNIGMIQALRNLIMSSSFLASASLLIAAGLLGFVAGAGQVSDLIHEMNFLGMRTGAAFSIKILMLIANFTLSFFSFSLAIRYYNYAVLRSTGISPDDTAAVADATRLIERGAVHYALGMRCYYFAIPLVLWLFGPILLGVGMAVMLVALYHHDHPFFRRR